MNTQDLYDGWSLTAVAGPVPADLVGRRVRARVPGTSHTALLEAGLIPDPYLDRHEEDLAWMRRTDWAYERDLDLAPAAADERVDLVFDGIDTVATLTFDGHELGRTANQHRSYRFDVRDLLPPDHPAAARPAARPRSCTPRPRPPGSVRARSPTTQPFNMVRKMACSFGWDWGPDLQTAGLWRPVRVERWRVARLAAVRPLVTVDADGHRARRGARRRRALGAARRRRRRSWCAPTSPAPTSPSPCRPTRARPSVDLEVPHAPLWWPVGHGAQPLSSWSSRSSARTPSEPLDTWTRRIGFRTVELDTSTDEDGTAFTFRVNGRPIFVKGANWIPDDHLLTRITRERLAHRLDQAVDAHLNLLRVWGGGIYESEDFYELCDERGLLVWQDFLLACAAYPEEQPLWDELEAEAREHVARLTPHPSLVLWNGGNENLWGFLDWGWQEELEGRTWGYRYATELLTGVVAELDPTRPYSDGSPYSPGAALDRGPPQRPRPRHPPPVGGVEPRRLHASTATRSPASARSSASRGRPRGRP